MNLSLHSKSFFNSPSPKPIIQRTQQPSQKQLSIEETNQDLIRPSSQTNQRSNSYLKLFPQHKRKHNVSLFNFFVNKNPKKNKDSIQQNHNQLKQSKRHLQEGNFIIKKVKGPFPSLNTQRIKILPINQRQKYQKCIVFCEKNAQESSLDTQLNDRNFNKINENLSKNTKFDRKKYMYYRYRKKNSPQKNSNSFKEILQHNQTQRPQHSKTSFAYINIKTFGEANQIDQSDSCHREANNKDNFLQMSPSKNKSFSQAKCKLTVEPMPRQSSYKLIDRKSLSKTTRQIRQKKQPHVSSNKVFTQAIHFKSRKTNPSKQTQLKQNPQKEKVQKKEEQILGWNLGEQLQIEEQYF